MCRFLAVAAFTGVIALAATIATPTISPAAEKTASALNFKMKSIDGKEVDLSKYKGKVVLIVNVASKCGNTPQYKGLEELYEKYNKEGFVILGVAGE